MKRLHLNLAVMDWLAFGDVFRNRIWHFLSLVWASLVPTDSHDLGGHRLCMKTAFERSNIELGETIGRLVCTENPLRVLKGQDVTLTDGIVTSLYKQEEV
ncbi:MAG: hypothetical protein H8D56_22535 [Planctomycetes bacterium]|nr:hypothetical protein [Planctomycetota bacterium]